MTKLTMEEKYGLSKCKAILIAVLLSIFALVLAIQFWPASKPIAAAPAVAPKNAGKRNKAKAVATSNQSKTTGQSNSSSPKKPPKLQASSKTNSSGAPSRTKTSTQPTASLARANASSASGIVWPMMELTEATAVDPFRLPASLQPEPEPTVEERQLAIESERRKEAAIKAKEAELARQKALSAEAKLAEAEALKKKEAVRAKIKALQNAGVEMFVSDGNSQVAKINGRFIRPGDEFDGIQVVDIRRDGTVVLRPVDDKPESVESQ